MPVGQTSSQTPLYLGQVVTCDPTQRIVEVVLNASGQRLQFMTFPVAGRWPIVGETWSVRFVNNTPYLCEPYQVYQSQAVAHNIEGIPSGDAWINSPTGILHVIGSATGSTDFSFNAKSWPTRGVATLASGTVTVASLVVTANSQIFLTAQDNNTVGVLRVSARTPGTSFVITSSSGSDHGLVAYQIWS